jgi:hypothetical protein
MNFFKPPLRNLNWMVLGLARTLSGILMVLCLGFVYIDLSLDWTEFLIDRKFKKKMKS